MENLSYGKDINRAWENIKENIKTSGKQSLCVNKLKDHKPWFDEECLSFLDQRDRAKRELGTGSKQSIVDNLNNVRCEASRYFRKKRTYTKSQNRGT